MGAELGSRGGRGCDAAEEACELTRGGEGIVAFRAEGPHPVGFRVAGAGVARGR